MTVPMCRESNAPSTIWLAGVQVGVHSIPEGGSKPQWINRVLVRASQETSREDVS